MNIDQLEPSQAGKRRPKRKTVTFEPNDTARAIIVQWKSRRIGSVTTLLNVVLTKYGPDGIQDLEEVVKMGALRTRSPGNTSPMFCSPKRRVTVRADFLHPVE